MAKTQAHKRAYTRNQKEIAQTIAVSLRPDRIQWIRQSAKARNVSQSDIVRDLIDEARRQAERESMTA